MARKPLDTLLAMLEADSLEQQTAAAIVLGELRPRGARPIAALERALERGEPGVQRPALIALARIAPSRAARVALPLVASHFAELQQAAVSALVEVGEEALPLVQARLAQARPEEQRALDGVLARLGGTHAFGALLSRLAVSDGETARNLAIGARPQLREADVKHKRSYLKELQRFVSRKAVRAAPAATAAAVKLMGYLELPEALPALLALARGKGDLRVREEAVAALRFLPSAALGRVAPVLVDIAERADPTLARAALFTLGNLPMTPALARRLGKLAAGAEAERAQIAIEHLGRQSSPAALAALADLVVGDDRSRAELAGAALKGKPAAVPALLAALESARGEQVSVLLRLLRGQTQQAPPSERRRVATRLVRRAALAEPGAQTLLPAAYELDAEVLQLEVRRELTRLERGRKNDAARSLLTALCHTDAATDADRYRLASLELVRKFYDTHPTARARDNTLRTLEQLARHGFDVGAALAADHSLGPEARYYLGFHFAEAGDPLGEELLRAVITRSGRGKVGAMARNKLALVQRGQGGEG